MSDSSNSPSNPPGATRDDMTSALFAQMVIQQTNLAMMLMGAVPHPQTGRTTHDLDGARMFIDQLEMLQVKTKGNLSPDEEKLLKQSLLSLQMMFVEAVESPEAAAPPQPEAEPAAPANPPAESKTAPAADAGSEDAESKKKFSKKY